MTIKEQLSSIAADMDQKTSQLNTDRLIAKLHNLKADLEDPSIDIPADVLETLDREARAVVLLGFVTLTATGLNDDR